MHKSGIPIFELTYLLIFIKIKELLSLTYNNIIMILIKNSKLSKFAIIIW